MRRLASIFALLVVAALACTTAELRPRRAHAFGTDTLIDKGSLYNKSSVTAGNNFLTTSITPTGAQSVFRIAVVLGSTAKLRIKETDGSTAFTSDLNGGTALTANTCYTFVWEARQTTPAGASLSYNFVSDQNTTVPILRVTECLGGVD